MTWRLPDALQPNDDDRAVALLRAYYRRDEGRPLGVAYTGARFDCWDSTGTRARDTDRFTADDLVALRFLSIKVTADTVGALLCDRADEFNDLLEQVGQDRDLADLPDTELAGGSQWPAWWLHERLCTIDGVDWVTAGKLLARKRPRLIPMYDSVVREVVGAPVAFWPAMHQALRADGAALHRRLLRLRAAADLPTSISALRVFDVLAWMSGQPQRSSR
ncbi:DUF6308 family protein [Dactylosporangium fulvum]|uniref:DUF6308 family protein n=1 Tax=Dactylosporangium fulvum TaxID=53359 RepID=A0ABY5VZ51_9ACTN|nr:DUF6308 family protein [Dactylosporangium fulvum]UWP83093.1 DUF6308 family protein [Dactylosporangium fulvum]